MILLVTVSNMNLTVIQNQQTIFFYTHKNSKHKFRINISLHERIMRTVKRVEFVSDGILHM